MNNRNRTIIQTAIPITLLVLAIAITVISRQPPNPDVVKVTRSFPTMGPGIMVNIAFYGNKATCEKAADAVRTVMDQVSEACNYYNPKSELSRLNQTAADRPFKCSKLLWDVLWASKQAHEVSGGSFDISAGPLMKLWGFHRKKKQLPSPEQLKKTLQKVGLQHVEFDETNHTVKFNKPGISLDLGGIAKGYAVGLAVREVEKLGVERGIIDLSGNMFCLPIGPPERDAYNIGIRNPFDRANICGVTQVVNRAVSTSGDYERYVTIDGKRYTHIMDVTTGEPVKNRISVTVITPEPVWSDILSTTIFIKGEKFARKICDTIPGTRVLIIQHPKDGSDEVQVIRIGNGWEGIKKPEKPATTNQTTK